MNIDVDLNKAECIKVIRDIGSRTYVNICDGSQQDILVPWGTGDWLGAVAFLGAVTITIGIFGLVGWMLAAMMKDH